MVTQPDGHAEEVWHTLPDAEQEPVGSRASSPPGNAQESESRKDSMLQYMRKHSEIAGDHLKLGSIKFAKRLAKPTARADSFEEYWQSSKLGKKELELKLKILDRKQSAAQRDSSASQSPRGRPMQRNSMPNLPRQTQASNSFSFRRNRQNYATVSEMPRENGGLLSPTNTLDRP